MNDTGNYITITKGNIHHSKYFVWLISHPRWSIVRVLNVWIYHEWRLMLHNWRAIVFVCFYVELSLIFFYYFIFVFCFVHDRKFCQCFSLIRFLCIWPRNGPWKTAKYQNPTAFGMWYIEFLSVAMDTIVQVLSDMYRLRILSLNRCDRITTPHQYR